MVFFNYALRKLNAKIVYYGPGLCGKTTNLQWIHDNFEGGQRGKMISLATEGDRTIFFDLLPLDIGTIRGMQVTLQLYTVPGQVHYNSTRQLVLKGADGVVFVADSQRAMNKSNSDSLKNLEENLLLQGIELRSFPFCLQFNKRDLRDVMSVEELDASLNPEFHVPFFEAVATKGIGVQETLEGIVKLVMRSLRQRYEPGEGARPGAPGRPRAMQGPFAPGGGGPRPPMAPSAPRAPQAPRAPMAPPGARPGQPPAAGQRPAAPQQRPGGQPPAARPAAPGQQAQRPPQQAQRPPQQAQRPPQQAQRPPQQAQRPPQQAQRPPQAQPSPQARPPQAQRPQAGQQQRPAPSPSPGAAPPVARTAPPPQRQPPAAEAFEPPPPVMRSDPTTGEMRLPDRQPSRAAETAEPVFRAASGEDREPTQVFKPDKVGTAPAPRPVPGSGQDGRGTDVLDFGAADELFELPGPAVTEDLGSPELVDEATSVTAADLVLDRPGSARDSGHGVDFALDADRALDDADDLVFGSVEPEPPAAQPRAPEQPATTQRPAAQPPAAQPPAAQPPAAQPPAAQPPAVQSPAVQSPAAAPSRRAAASVDDLEESIFGAKKRAKPPEPAAAEPSPPEITAKIDPPFPKAARRPSAPVVLDEEDPFGDQAAAADEPALEPDSVFSGSGPVVPSISALRLDPHDNQLAIRLEGTGAIAESGQVRALDIQVPVPGAWVGHRRVTIQLRLTLEPTTEEEDDGRGGSA